MMKFFRTLRQRLLTQNRFSKYLLYGIGEIALVVIGILIALQIDTWNEERKNTREANRLSRDLLEEVEMALGSREEYLQENISTLNTMASALDKIFSSPPRELTPGECESIFYSHMIRWDLFNLTTLDEMITTGKISIISDLKLRNALLEFRNLASSNKERINATIFEVNVLVDNFPHLIVRDWVIPDQKSIFTCNVEAMRENRYFLAQLQSNRGRLTAPIYAAEREVEALSMIRDILRETF